jgi:hypothetical protein
LQTLKSLLPDTELVDIGFIAETVAERSARSLVDNDAMVFPASTIKHANGTRENSLGKCSEYLEKEEALEEHLHVKEHGPADWVVLTKRLARPHNHGEGLTGSFNAVRAAPKNI